MPDHAPTSTEPRAGRGLRRANITSAAQQAAESMAEEILAYDGDEEEWLLGSESTLMEHLGVGRPTLRQASRLLEQQQLLIVRRGIRGGIFGRRPTAEGVTDAARVFLRSQRTTFREVLEAELVVGPACAAMAASSDDLEARQALARHYPDDGDSLGLRQFMDLSTQFQRQVSLLSGSAVMFLFVNVLMDLAAQAGGVADAYRDPARRAATVLRHTRIAEAIAAGDSSLAAKRMRSHLASIIEWCDDRSLALTLEPRVL
jgi:DNA-binding FadR family transcriptional regulator